MPGVTGPPSPNSEDKNPPNAPKDTSQEDQNDDINEKVSPASSVVTIDRTPNLNFTPITFLSNAISLEEPPIPVLTVRLDSKSELISNAESEDYDDKENKQFDEEVADDDSIHDNLSFGSVGDDENQYQSQLISFDHSNAKTVGNLINASLSPIKIPQSLSYVISGNDDVTLKGKDSRHTKNQRTDNKNILKEISPKQDNTNNKQGNNKKTFGIPTVCAKDVMSISYTCKDTKQKLAGDVIQPASSNRKEYLPIRVGSTGKTKATIKRNDPKNISAEINNKKSNEAPNKERNTLTADMRSNNDEKKIDIEENQANNNNNEANPSTESPKGCEQKTLDQIKNEALDEKLADIERSRNIPENAEILKEKAQKINVIRQVIVDQSKFLEELNKYHESVPNEDVLMKQGCALLTIQDSINNLFGIKNVRKERPITLGDSVSKDVVTKHITPASVVNKQETTIIVKTPSTKGINNGILRDDKLNLRLQSQLNNLHDLAEMEVMKFQDTKKLFDKNKLNESDDNFEVNLDDDLEDDQNEDEHDEDEEYRDEDEDERDEDEEDCDESDDTGKKGPVTDDKVKKFGPEFKEDMIKGEMLHDVSNIQQISHKTSHTSRQPDIREEKIDETSEKLDTKEQERNETDSLEKTDDKPKVEMINIESKNSNYKEQIIETPHVTIKIENTKVNDAKDSERDSSLEQTEKDIYDKDDNAAKVMKTVQGFSVKMSTEIIESKNTPINPASTIIVNNLYKSTAKEVATNMKTKEPSWSIMSESTYGTDSDLEPNTNESDDNTEQSADSDKNKLDKMEKENNPTSIKEHSKEKLGIDKNVTDNNTKNDINTDNSQEPKSFEPKSIITSNLVKVNNDSEKNSNNILKYTNDTKSNVEQKEKDKAMLENPEKPTEVESDNITNIRNVDTGNVNQTNETVSENLKHNVENQESPATAETIDNNSPENKYTTDPIEKRDTKEIKNLVNEVENGQNMIAVLQRNQTTNQEMNLTNQDNKIGLDTENCRNESDLHITDSENTNSSVDNKKHDPTDIMKSISSLKKQADANSVSSKENYEIEKKNDSLPALDIRNSEPIEIDQAKPMFYRIIHQPPYARANVDGSITPIKQPDENEKTEEQSFLIQVVIPDSKSPNHSLHQQDTLKATDILKGKTVLDKNATQESPEGLANDNLQDKGNLNKDPANRAQIEPAIVTIAPRNVVNIIDREDTDQTEALEESQIGKRWKTIKRGILRHLPFYRYRDDG